MHSVMIILMWLALISIFGYIVSIFFEHINLVNHQIHIKSKTVTQKILDDIDVKVFKLGNRRLNIGDELKLTTKDERRLRGVLLGAKSKTNEICIITRDDRLVTMHLRNISNLKVTEKYGRLF